MNDRPAVAETARNPGNRWERAQTASPAYSAAAMAPVP